MTTPEFTAPGPGTWTPDRAHMSKPATPFLAEAFPNGMTRGFKQTLHRYGAVLSHLQVAFVNGVMYGHMVPAPGEEIPERFANAEQAWSTKQWRTDLAKWNDEVKPDSVRINRGLAQVDVGALDDAALADHIVECRDNLELMAERHHYFTATAMLTIGDFLARVLPMGVASPAELLDLMRGASELSAGSGVETRAVADALRADPEARKLLDGDDPAAAIEALRRQPGAVGEAMSAFIDFVGHRPLDGLDITSPIVLEHPELLVTTLKTALEPERADDHDARAAAIRDRVPEAERATFDEALAEARVVYGVRDERGLYQDVWAGGIARKGMVEAGRRLAAAGRVHDAADVFEATAAEAAALLGGSNGGSAGGATAPSADELAARRRQRESIDHASAPDVLGDPPSPPPPMDGLPPAVLRTMGALMIGLTHLFGAPPGAPPAARPGADAPIKGIGVGDGSYEGVARVVAGPEELHRIEDGDVLVTPCTTEAFNVAVPLLGALVTDHGGLLSHPAIVAREFGLPAVIGCGNATIAIADGARVRVDAKTGEVALLS